MVWMLSPRPDGQLNQGLNQCLNQGKERDRGERRTWLGKSLDGLPSREQVDRIIARESARAERNGQPLSVVLFRMKGGRCGAGGRRRLSRCERRLALTLMRRVRLTDDVGWFDDRHLCVVLPDTPAAGARVFADNLCDEVARKSPRPLSVIYTYPCDGAAEGPARSKPARSNGRSGHDRHDGHNGHNGENGENGENGHGGHYGHDSVLRTGRSRIFGTGGFNPSGNFDATPVGAVGASVGGLGHANGYPFGESAFRHGRAGGLALLHPRAEERLSPPAPSGANLAAVPIPATAALSKPRASAAPAAEVSEAGEPAVQPLHALLARPMPRWKRALDVLGAAAGLTLLSPLFAVVAAAIKLTSPGPVVFTQKRCGLGGRTFTIYKFRTMCADAEAKKQALRRKSEQDGPAFKLKNDPRITRVGHLLRKTSIDELPQLWNVLKGDMSLVGPRPLPVDESAGCERWQKRRLDVTPGLTCIWQIEGRSQVTFAEWVRMDVKYMRRLTLLHDLSILFKTVPAVLLRKGAR